MSGIWGYLHPVYQACVLVLGLFVLSLGLRVRRSRRLGPSPAQARLAARHIRLGRLFVLLLTAGYFIGLGGMRFALGENLYQTAHSYFGTLALALLLGTAYLGRRLRLRPGDDETRQLHSYCAFLTIFLALVVAFLGFILLP